MRILFLATVLSVTLSVSAETTIAVFPPHGVNTDQSFLDAFGMLLTTKYRGLVEGEVLAPHAAGRAVSDSTTLAEAARKLNADEYLEIEAVGLYLSRTEKAKYELRSVEGQKQTIIVKLDSDEDDEEVVDDQKLLDDHKTVVTVTRRNNNAERIHQVEMTLVTYGDIEESTDRIAKAIYRGVSVDEVRGPENVTRRESIQRNKLFTESHKGIKVGVFQPVYQDLTFSNIATIGYNHRMEAEKFFFELGVNAKIPTELGSDNNRIYGGVQMEMGGSYFLTPGAFGLYTGLGVSPFLNFGSIASGEGPQVGILPFVQLGASFPRTTSMRAFVNFKVGYNAAEITTGNPDQTEYSYDYYSGVDEEQTIPGDPPRKDTRPFELGMEFGIGF
jgi:hypothetical protein